MLHRLLLLAIIPVAGCTSMGDAFMHVENVRVTEMRRANDCGPATAKPQLQLFADRGALETWQFAQRLEFPDGPDDALPPGVYALIEYPISGGALVVSRQARLREEDGLLTLNASFLSPSESQPVKPDTFAPSACVLVALPKTAKVQVLVLRDEAGNERARADAKTKVSVPAGREEAEAPSDISKKKVPVASDPVPELPPPKSDPRP